MDMSDDNRLPYVALSYIWGKPDFTEDLYLDDNNVLKITPSLASALRQFRYIGALRLIWVDAIFIDQQDDVDKSLSPPS